MVTGASCVAGILLSLAISTAVSAAPPTPLPDEAATGEEGAGMVKRLAGNAHDSMLRYLLMAAMSDSGTRYTQPQLLNRGVRRMGSEFLGKRSSPYPEETDDGEQREACEDDGPCGVESSEEDLKKEHLSFTGQFDYDGGANQETSDLFNSKAKRMAGHRGRDLSHIFSIYMPKNIDSEFQRKRMGSEFLGKRAMGSEFLGKRAMGSEFLGKRAMGSEFLGKRMMGSEFLGKRAMGSEFLGKRAMGSEFLGKRAMGSEFLGKRAMGSEFLGKRAMRSEFLGKRGMGSEFLGKRAMGSEFLGKRAMGSEFLG